MLFSSTLTLLALPLAALASPISTPRYLSARTTCPTYMVIEIPGLGDDTGSYTGSTTAKLLASYPGGERYLIKTPPPPDSGPNTNFEEIIEQSAKGSAEITGVVAESFATCPQTKIVLFGYSYGTIVAIESMNDPAFLRAPITAVILFGNCFWHGGRLEDQGTATSGTSVCGQIEGLATPPTFEDITHDYCLVNDYLCTGTSYTAPDNAHWSYFTGPWGGYGVEYVVSRLQADDLNAPVPTSVAVTSLVPTASEVVGLATGPVSGAVASVTAGVKTTGVALPTTA